MKLLACLGLQEYSSEVEIYLYLKSRKSLTLPDSVLHCEKKWLGFKFILYIWTFKSNITQYQVEKQGVTAVCGWKF